MAHVLTEGTQSASSSTGKMLNVVLWVLQIAAAGMFLMVGFFETVGKCANGRTVRGYRHRAVVPLSDRGTGSRRARFCF